LTIWGKEKKVKKFLLYSIAVGFFFANLASSYAHWTDSRDWGMHGPGMMGWGWWGMGWIFMIIFWGLIIVGLIFLIRWLAGLSRSRAPYDKTHDSAIEILKQRYAKGEINKNEFEEKKRDLT